MGQENKSKPSLVFIIISILSLAGAAVVFSMYMSANEKFANSQIEISRLRSTNETLMNRNSELLMQIGGIEDEKRKLEEFTKAQAEKPNADELMFTVDEQLIGITKIKGYFAKLERPGEDGSEECTSFVITGSPNVFSGYLENTSVNQPFVLSAENGFSIAISREGVSDLDWEKIVNSKDDKPVEMTVLKQKVNMNYGPHPCESIINILKVE